MYYADICVLLCNFHVKLSNPELSDNILHNLAVQCAMLLKYTGKSEF